MLYDFRPVRNRLAALIRGGSSLPGRRTGERCRGQVDSLLRKNASLSILERLIRQTFESSTVTDNELHKIIVKGRQNLMKYICLGYIDEKKFAELPQEEIQRLMGECFAYDDELRRGGHFVGGEALDSARNAVTLRMKNGNVEVTDGPYAETKEVLGGILLLEARDLNHAISLMSKHPGVRIGPFEIRPADEEINRLVAERDAAIAKK